MALTLSGTNGIVGAGFTLDASGASVTAGVGTFTSLADGSTDGSIDLGLTVAHFRVKAGSQVGLTTFVFGDTQVGSAVTDIARFGIVNNNNSGMSISMDDDSNLSYIRHRDNGGDIGVILRHGSQNRERIRIMSDGKVGIGSTIPTTTLDVNGVITGDGSGLTAVNTPSFAARLTTTVTLSTSTETTIVFNVEDHDTDSAYNTSTGEFTVPSGKGGVYFIAAQFGIDDPGEVGDIVRLRVFKNGSLLSGFRSQVQQATANVIVSTSISGSETLAAGDVIKCEAFTDSNVGDANIEVDCTYFSMFRLSI